MARRERDKVDPSLIVLTSRTSRPSMRSRGLDYTDTLAGSKESAVDEQGEMFLRVDDLESNAPSDYVGTNPSGSFQADKIQVTKANRKLVMNSTE